MISADDDGSCDVGHLGLFAADVLREAQEWLVDENLEASVPEGSAMTCDLIEEVTFNALASRPSDPERVAQDPRFATAISRAAIASGFMERVAYE